MLKEIKMLINKTIKQYKYKKIWKKVSITLSLLAVSLTLYSLILPAFTLNDENNYTLKLIDNYNYSWKEDKVTSYDLNLYFVDTKGNNIEGKDITIEIGPNALEDHPYGFGYIPVSGETTRGLNIIDELKLTEYTLPTGEKYQFDHAEVYLDNSWKIFSGDSNHWDIWCQYSSSESSKEDYGWRGKYSDNIPYTITTETEYKLVYKKIRYGKENSVESLSSESGITFNMFNYSGTNEKSGINDNGLWNYFTFRDSSLEPATTINKNTDADGFTENRAKVLSNLQNGYPVFDCKNYCNNSSLGYLFGDTINADGLETKGVTSYHPTNTPLQKETVEGVEYYYYDSNRNAVDYDTENNTFIVRKYLERGYQLSSYPKEINRYEFLPFNYWNDTRNINTLKETNFTYNYEAKEIDHWFGMTMEFDFYMPKDGTINNSDMIFSFSGDDDVWVFIDDVLVLDLGGTHGAVDGNINFKTGEVTSYLNWNGTLGIPNKTNIYNSFKNANSLNKITWNEDGTTFENYTRHTLKFFYLERGAAISNCKIRFNIPVLPSGSLSVQKLYNGIDKYNDEYEFTLYDVTNNTPSTNTKYTINNQEYYTDSSGRFKLKTGEVASFTLTNYHTYFVEETNTGMYSINDSCTLDKIKCNNSYQTEEFTIDPESSYEVVFTNKIKTYNLSVSKIAYNANTDEEFKFKIELYDSDNQKIDIPTNIVSENYYEIDKDNKVLIYYLKDTETIKINNIPLDTLVNIEETNHDGYNTIIKSKDITLAETDNYSFTIDSDKNIIFYNIPGYTLPETGGPGILQYTFIGILFIIITLLLKYNYNKKLKEGGY